MIETHLAKILIETEVSGTEVAASIRRNARGVDILELPAADVEEQLRHLGLTQGKRVLLVKEFRGRFFKQCQGLKADYACCNLHTLAEANGCAMECTYCILQYYLTTPHLSIFANLRDFGQEISRVIASQPDRMFRIGTGELSDSLLLDPLTESTRHMVPFFRSLPNAVLELKTKTDNVANLLDLEHGGRTVVSWSVNPPEVVSREELKTAPLEDRLRAASRVALQGYAVGFHVDPMIHYPDWKAGYAFLVDALVDAVPPASIAWISLGSLRFPPEMKATLEARFPHSELRYGELVRGTDGKVRYLRPLRLEMYLWVVERLRQRLGPKSAPIVYLCMESAEVWKRVFQEAAPTNAELEFRFAENFQRRFPQAELPLPRLQDYEEVAAIKAAAANSLPAPSGAFVPVADFGL
jgi:spore photoproduct lyase